MKWYSRRIEDGPSFIFYILLLQSRVISDIEFAKDRDELSFIFHILLLQGWSLRISVVSNSATLMERCQKRIPLSPCRRQITLSAECLKNGLGNIQTHYQPTFPFQTVVADLCHRSFAGHPPLQDLNRSVIWDSILRNPLVDCWIIVPISDVCQTAKRGSIPPSWLSRTTLLRTPHHTRGSTL